MSLSQFQAALALLIRRPSAFRGQDLDPFLAGFDLSHEEVTRLQSLAGEPKVEKFGKAMRGVRTEMVEEGLPVSKHFIRPDALRFLQVDVFEPQEERTSSSQLTRAFLDFMNTDAKAYQVLEKEAAPFIFDMLKFEQAQHHLRQVNLSSSTQANPMSRMLHPHFAILWLDYDVPGFLNLWGKDGVEAPERRSVVILMVRRSDRPDYHLFEIDSSLGEWLREGALSSYPGAESDLRRLVEIGFLKPCELVQ